ncbi:MAG: HAMP domain-containing protein [Chloroflexota bacterium]|nr:HAMP domain-containing protein [Chloroflexota bacterium]
MWRFLTNMSIAQRLMVAAIITALVPGIVISILGSSYVTTLSTVNDTVQAEDNAVKLATDMQADLLRMNALLGTLNLAPISAADNVLNSREISQLTDDFSVTLAAYQQDYQIATSARMESIREALKSDSQGNQEPTSQHAMIYVVNLQWKLYNQAQQQVLATIQQNTGVNTLLGTIAQANLEYLPLKGNLDNLVQQTESISQIVVQLNTFKIYPILFWTILAFLFSTLVVFATSYLINLSITRPLRQLIHLTERIAHGDTDARALVIGHDETYMVAASMNTMLDSVVSLMKNIQQQHDGLEAHVQKLIDEVKGLGSGDLRSRAEVTSDALGFLAHSFNYIIDELSSRMVRIKTITDEIETVTGTTRQQMTQSLHISMHQIQTMAEAIGAVERLIVLTMTVADQSLALTASARETQQVTQEQQTVIENITASLNQQLHLSRSVLCILQSAAEANKRNSDSTHKATHSIGKLSHLVALLHASLGTFKLREEV